MCLPAGRNGYFVAVVAVVKRLRAGRSGIRGGRILVNKNTCWVEAAGDKREEQESSRPGQAEG